MTRLAFLIAFGVLAAPVGAQQALEEQFQYSLTGMFPPAGWTEVNVNAGPNLGWEDPSVQVVSVNWIGVDAAGHDDYFLSTATNDFRLVTPVFDLSGFQTPRLVFDESLGFASYLATYPGSIGDGVSAIEASTDGGLTWVQLWTDTRISDCLYVDIELDLAAYADAPAVQLAFHYYGTGAHTWVVDNVRVDNGPQLPTLVVNGMCPGPATIEALYMTPNQPVYFGYSYMPGQSVIQAGPCAGTVLPMLNPVLRRVLVADLEGKVSFGAWLPKSACGHVTLIGFDVATCAPTNVVAI